MTTIWNFKQAPQDLLLTLYYHGGRYRIPIHLGPLQSYNLDVMTLIRSRKPDMDGNLIPDNITSGSAVLSGPSGDRDKISVSVSSATYNVRNATCGSNCTTCNGATEFTLVPASYFMKVAATAHAQSQVTWNTGSVYTNPPGTTWSTASSSIATVGTSGTILGKSAGQTSTAASLGNYPVYSQNCSGDMTGGCPEADLDGGAPTDVTPTISIGEITPIPLANYVPQLLTGIGIVVAMQVGPADQDFDGTQFTEAVTTQSNNCPANFGNLCGGSSTFTVGEGGSTLGVNFLGQQNVFYDQHVSGYPNSVLDADDIQSCVAICTQTYSLNGTPVGSFKIKRSFSKGVIGPYAVSDVTVEKTQ